MKGPIKRSSKPQQLGKKRKYSKDQKKLLRITKKNRTPTERKNALTASRLFVESVTGNNSTTRKPRKKK